MLLQGNCLETLKTLDNASVDSIVTDPPYELGFMGKSWDSSGIAYNQYLWAECLRVLKPGGHLLAFSGSRTYHRMVVAIEDSGFEIRDQIMWIYGSGFPKSLNLKDEWEGWGTALKPAHEPIVVARKPLSGTVAANVLEWGTGALNIDGSRVGTGTGETVTYEVSDIRGGNFGQDKEAYADREKLTYTKTDQGRWPANVIHDGLEEDWSRFFYCAKASKAERNAGLEGLPETTKQGARPNSPDMTGKFPDHDHRPTTGNFHPTVKPLALMRYLIKLVTPPGGIVLDPFLGSGTTAVAATLEGFKWIGCEMTEDYFPIIESRVELATNQRNA